MRTFGPLAAISECDSINILARLPFIGVLRIVIWDRGWIIYLVCYVLFMGMHLKGAGEALKIMITALPLSPYWCLFLPWRPISIVRICLTLPYWNRI